MLQRQHLRAARWRRRWLVEGQHRCPHHKRMEKWGGRSVQSRSVQSQVESMGRVVMHGVVVVSSCSISECNVSKQQFRKQLMRTCEKGGEQ